MVQTAGETAIPLSDGHFNFAEHLIAGNRGRARKIAYIDDTRTLSYGELETATRKFAAALLAAGVRREERILLLIHDCCDWPVAFLGAMYAGVVPVAVNTLLTADDYAYMLEHSRAQLVVVSSPLLPTLRKAMAAGHHEVHTTVVIGSDECTNDNAVAFDEFIAGLEPLPSPATTGPDDPGFWLYSSGSTGRPKATLHSHANPYWTAEFYGKATLALREDDICFSAAKLFFAYGLGNSLSFPLSVGATTVLMAGRPTPDAVIERLVRHQPTVFFGAPTGYAALLASPDLPESDQLSLRLCSSAGEALPIELGKRFHEQFGVDLLDGIGSTEMLHIFISNSPGRVNYGSSGWPVTGYDVAVLDDGGQPVPDGDIGDLFVKGPSAALCYWGDRRKSNESFRGEWTKTGDKYVRNDDGSYTCVGRADDMFKVSGIFVSPFEVESTLIEHPAVLEAAVVGIPDADGLVKSKAFVVLRDGHEATESELQAFVKERLAPYKYPRSIAMVQDLPKTATGKIQRFKLRDMH